MNRLEFAPRTLCDIAVECPEDLLFFSLDTLKTTGLKACQAPNVRAAVVAELCIRYFLSSDSDILAILQDVLPAGESLEFVQQLPLWQEECDAERLCQCLWNPRTDFSRQCVDRLRWRLRHLLEAEGLIPVIWQRRGPEDRVAYLLPFRFGDKKQGVGVFDADGKELLNQEQQPEWSGYLRKMGLEARVQLLCRVREGVPPFTGDSMMLPVQMAWWRRQGGSQGLLKYPPFSIVATGAFDDEGLLKPVAVAPKAAAVKRGLYRALFIYPRNAESVAGDTLPLAQNLSREEVHAQIQKQIEQRVHWDCDYAIRRFQDMAMEVRAWHFSDWGPLLRRLDMAKIWNKYEFPKEYMLNLMLRSEAYCHCGRTPEAQRLNQEARVFAASQGEDCRYYLLRLEIEQMVQRQDEEGFGKLAELEAELSGRLEEFSDNDLWMRFHGTMAQAYAYAYVAKLPWGDQAKALQHAEAAIRCAVRGGEANDIAQDLNYRHLLFVLFAPGTPEEDDAYQEALAKCRELKHTKDKSYVKNSGFLHRAKVMAWYRQLLRTGMAPAYKRALEMVEVLNARYWPGACVGKYLGALAAEEGRRAEAVRYFEKGEAAIADEEVPGVVSLIKLTVLAEAYRSLGDAAWLEKARKLAKTLPDSIAPITLPRWRAYLDNPANAEFPGLKYWY